MLPGGNVYKGQRLDTFGSDVGHLPWLPVLSPVGRQSCSSSDRGPHAQQHPPRCSVLARTSIQLLGPSSAQNNSSTSISSTSEVLRPRRFSAPVIARLIRSTTNLQELTDVVQQQIAYFDPAHVGIAHIHLALLVGQMQRGGQLVDPQASVLEASAASAGRSILTTAATTSSGGGGGINRQGVVSLSARNGSGAAAAALNGTVTVVAEDDLEPLVMSSLLDDDDDDDDDLGGDGGLAGGRSGPGAAGSERDDDDDDGLLVVSAILDEGESLVEAAQPGPLNGHTGQHGSNGNGNGARASGNGADIGVTAHAPFGPGSEASSASDSGIHEYETSADGYEPDSLIDAAAAAADLRVPEELDPAASSRLLVLPAANGEEPGSADGSAHENGRESSTERRTAEATANIADSGASTLGWSRGGDSNAQPPGPPVSGVAGTGTLQAEEQRSRPATTAASAAAAGGGGGGIPLAQLPPVAGLLRLLLPAVFSSLDALRGSDLAAVLSALAALRYGDRLVVGQLMQVMAGKLSACRAQDLSNVWCSAALLGVPPDPDVRSSFYSVVRRRARRFAPRDLAMTVWAYGAVGCDVPEETLLALLTSSRSKLVGFSPLHLAKMAQGLAALRYRPFPEWVDAYCQALRPALRRMSSRELCALLLALASLQIALDDTTRATLLVHTLTALPSLEPSQLARCIWALGRLTAAGLPALIDLDTSARVLDVTGATLGSFSAGELQQLLEGLTRLALQPPLDWMQAYVAVLQPKLKDMDARQLAGVLGSLAAQQYRPMPEMQEVVLAVTQANMQQLLADTTCTASLVTALRRLNIEPPPSWVGALLEASRSALKNRSNDLHLANLAGSLAAWGVRPDGRWAARLMWRSQALMSENRMSPRALAALLQAMISLGIRPNELWSALCLQSAAARASQPSFEPQHYSTITASLHALGVRPPQRWLSRMLLSTYRCWDGFNMSHWSSLLPALVLLEAQPPREWLVRLEATTAPRLANCSALQLLTLLVSLHQLHQLQAAGATARLPLRERSLLSRTASRAAGATKQRRGSAKASGRASPGSLPGRPSDGNRSATAAAKEARLHRRSVLVPARASALAGGASKAKDEDHAAAADAAPAGPAEEVTSAEGVDPERPAEGQEFVGPGTQPASPATGSQVKLPSGAFAEAAVVGRVHPGAAWMDAWWASSTRLLTTVRYAPSELALTAGWLVTLELTPPADWLQACVEVAERYGKVMGAEERQQLAAAMLPLVRGIAVHPQPQPQLQPRPELPLQQQPEGGAFLVANAPHS